MDGERVGIERVTVSPPGSPSLIWFCLASLGGKPADGHVSRERIPRPVELQGEDGGQAASGGKSEGRLTRERREGVSQAIRKRSLMLNVCAENGELKWKGRSIESTSPVNQNAVRLLSLSSTVTLSLSDSLQGLVHVQQSSPRT